MRAGPGSESILGPGASPTTAWRCSLSPGTCGGPQNDARNLLVRPAPESPETLQALWACVLGFSFWSETDRRWRIRLEWIHPRRCGRLTAPGKRMGSSRGGNRGWPGDRNRLEASHPYHTATPPRRETVRLWVACRRPGSGTTPALAAAASCLWNVKTAAGLSRAR